MRKEQVPESSFAGSCLELVHDRRVTGRTSCLTLAPVFLLVRINVIFHEAADLGKKCHSGIAELIGHFGLPKLRSWGRVFDYVYKPRNARRMTLPVVVRGRSSMNSTCRGTSWGARRSLTCVCSSEASCGDGSKPERRTTNALGTWPRRSSGTPTTATSATAGWLPRQSSISPGPIR